MNFVIKNPKKLPAKLEEIPQGERFSLVTEPNEIYIRVDSCQIPNSRGGECRYGVGVNLLTGEFLAVCEGATLFVNKVKVISYEVEIQS